MGNSDDLRVGEWAVAIGNPFGLDQTVTVGVISATGRPDVGIATYENFIQTDASINPGNSGGPLVNLKGEVVGINTAIVADGSGHRLRHPLNLAKRVVDQLDREGQGRPRLARRVAPAAVSRARAEPRASGANGAVVGVDPRRPRRERRPPAGDVIVGLQKTPVDDYRQVQRLVAECRVG